MTRPNKREWILYLPKAYHPLLLHQHRKNLHKARKDLKNAFAVSYTRAKNYFHELDYMNIKI